MTPAKNSPADSTPTSVTVSTTVFAFGITMLGLLALLGAVAVS